MAQHHFLLHFTNLHTRRIDGIATLLDTIARQIAAGTTGIAHNHTEVARLVTLQRYRCPRFGMIGNVILGIIGRTVSLGVGIDAEHGIVARLTGPHPVVGLTTVFTH